MSDKTVMLVGKTLKGKNRLRESNTNTWRIVRISDKVGFSQEPGPWFLVRPCIKDSNESQWLSRWVHSSNDKDFTIIEV